jgi:predicted TIM-barrel fold metal-dependent hydrolase
MQPNVAALPLLSSLVLVAAVASTAPTYAQPSRPGQPLLLRDFQPKSMLRVPSHEVPRAKYPVVDFHNHVSNMPVDDLLAVMAASNIETVVNFSGGSGNRLRAQIERFAPHGDKVLVFANVDFRRIDEPDFGARAAAQLEADVKAGARGLKVFKSLGLTVKDQSGRIVPVDDPRLDPIWAKAGELGIPVAIHVADPDAFFVPVDRFNERWEELQAHPNWSFAGPEFPSKDEILAQRNAIVERHPKTTFVALHVANRPEDLAQVSGWLDKYPNMHVEIGARLAELGRQPYTARDFFLKYADRIMFGIDSTPRVSTYEPYFRFLETRDEYFDYFTSPTQGRWKIYGIFLPDDVLEKVYRTNARRILRLD